MKADMDGTNAQILVSDMKDPAGIVIDWWSSAAHLVWVENQGDVVWSSRLDGSAVARVLRPPEVTDAWGPAIRRDQL